MKLKEIREMYPEGTQIVLTEMAGESQMPYGLKGTVKFVDDAGQIHMSWENGSSLALNIHEDTFEKVEAPEKISVILVEPGKYPKLIEIEDTLEAMQSLVEGDIEEYMPFEDEVAIICNEEGKMNGMPLNRAVYSEPENVEMSYPQLKAHFRQAEKERNHTTGYIVFTADSFDKPYTEEQRTYVVSSNNKAFIEGMGGYSIYASSLDGSDKCVRLEAYMADEHGGKDGCSADSFKARQAVPFIVVDYIFKRQVADSHIAVSVVIAKDKLHIVIPRFGAFSEYCKHLAVNRLLLIHNAPP